MANAVCCLFSQALDQGETWDLNLRNQPSPWFQIPEYCVCCKTLKLKTNQFNSGTMQLKQMTALSIGLARNLTIFHPWTKYDMLINLNRSCWVMIWIQILIVNLTPYSWEIIFWIFAWLGIEPETAWAHLAATALTSDLSYYLSNDNRLCSNQRI